MKLSRFGENARIFLLFHFPIFDFLEMMLSIPSRGEPDTKDPGNERIRTGQTISDFFSL